MYPNGLFMIRTIGRGTQTYLTVSWTQETITVVVEAEQALDLSCCWENVSKSGAQTGFLFAIYRRSSGCDCGWFLQMGWLTFHITMDLTRLSFAVTLAGVQPPCPHYFCIPLCGDNMVVYITVHKYWWTSHLLSESCFHISINPVYMSLTGNLY